MATRVNAHEERLATLTSVMNVISVLERSAPRRSVTDRWLDLRALMPTFEPTNPVDESWSDFVASPETQSSAARDDDET